MSGLVRFSFCHVMTGQKNIDAQTTPAPLYVLQEPEILLAKSTSGYWKSWGDWRVQQEGKWNFMSDNSREKKCVTTKAMFLNRKLFLVFWQALVTERSNLPSWMIEWTHEQPHSAQSQPAMNQEILVSSQGTCLWKLSNFVHNSDSVKMLHFTALAVCLLFELYKIHWWKLFPFSITELTQYIHWQANLVQQEQKKAESLLWTPCKT